MLPHRPVAAVFRAADDAVGDEMPGEAPRPDGGQRPDEGPPGRVACGEAGVSEREHPQPDRPSGIDCRRVVGALLEAPQVGHQDGGGRPPDHHQPDHAGAAPRTNTICTSPNKRSRKPPSQ